MEEREKRQNVKVAAPKGQQADYGRVSTHTTSILLCNVVFPFGIVFTIALRLYTDEVSERTRLKGL